MNTTWLIFLALVYLANGATAFVIFVRTMDDDPEEDREVTAMSGLFVGLFWPIVVVLGIFYLVAMGAAGLVRRCGGVGGSR